VRVRALKISLDTRMPLSHTHAVMKRTTVWMTPGQVAKLKKASKDTGLKVAELLRRYIDEGLSKQK
jgi:hypothetical protein